MWNALKWVEPPTQTAHEIHLQQAIAGKLRGGDPKTTEYADKYLRSADYWATLQA